MEIKIKVRENYQIWITTEKECWYTSKSLTDLIENDKSTLLDAIVTVTEKYLRDKLSPNLLILGKKKEVSNATRTVS